MFENALPVNDALAHGGHVRDDFVSIEGAVIDVLRVGKLFEIFDMDQGKAPGIFGEPFQRIGAADVGPAHIHFHLHEVGVGVLNQDVVGQGSIGTGNELHPMAVIGELNAVFLGDFAGVVVGIGGALPAIGLTAQRAINGTNDEIGLAHDVAMVGDIRPFFDHVFVVECAGGRGHAEAIEHGAGCFGIVDGGAEFDFLVTDGGDLFQGAGEVGFQQIADGIGLDADAVESCEARRPRKDSCRAWQRRWRRLWFRENCGGSFCQLSSSFGFSL